MLKVISIVLVALAIGIAVYIITDKCKHNAHDIAMHEEHQRLHEEHEAIMFKTMENGAKLDMLLNIATNRCYCADK